jgi:hypothetical protein
MTKTIILEANSLGDLQSKSMGYNHDRCRTLYFDKSKYLPVEMIRLFDIDNPAKYVAIFEEEIPLIINK